MRKKRLISWIVLAILTCAFTFYAGYVIGSRNHDSEGPSAFHQALRSKWVKEEKPPLPTITIQGIPIEVARGGYSWCSPTSSNESRCVSVDASIPELTATVVPAGSEIKTEAPQGIKEFTITNTSNDSNDDPYFVPKTKGKYLYNIHCEWFLDQGQAEYYFLVEVL
ncbi:hypothetical protein DFP94_101671 [Fontibacillus phaseoli]|uniref:Uncharacterized protein n=1 Tax=Fontibacillus phaseoli TaxID=1416533 RepID=A0A369BN89_9BACL|nr:hypothetical protein [Fontibacillus phaseoli]RCX23079.1 hypothetical protein DFP94_101671 [Fontibacillus phaseoli]